MALMRDLELRVSHFNAQNLANTSWACAKGGQSDEKLLLTLARLVE